MGAIAYPKSRYDCLLTLQTANPETVVLYGSGRLPQERYDQLLRPRSGTNTTTTRSSTPRAVQSTTSPSKQASTNIQLDRLPQEWYDRLLRPRSGTSTPTTRSPTPRVVRSTTSPRKGHKHSNNSIAYPKSGTIDYVAQGGAQTLQQLDRLPQERYNQLLQPKSGTNTPNNSVADPKSETSYGKA